VNRVRPGLARLAAAALVAALPPLAFHALIVAQGASALVVAAGWLGAVAVALLLARLAGAGALGLVAAVAFVATLALASRGTGFGVYVAPVATWLVLLVVFGRTLRAGREPLVTTLARLCHDEALSPGMARYTRAATVAWCVFFASVAAGLAIAAALLPLAGWSLLANVAALPLVLLMFAGEYAVRRRRFPDIVHVHPVAMAARLARSGWHAALAGK
jgi:uncharacterized membrane protein